MNKVFIVIESSYYGSEFTVLGTFDGKEKANDYCEAMKAKWTKGKWEKSFDGGWKNDDYEWIIEIVEQEVI